MHSDAEADVLRREGKGTRSPCVRERAFEENAVLFLVIRLDGGD